MTADDGAWPSLEWCTASAEMVHGGCGRGARGRQHPGRDHANGALHKGLVLVTVGPGWEDGGAVVLRHLLVGFVEHHFRPGILDNTSLEFVRREDAGNAAEIPVNVDMTG